MLIVFALGLDPKKGSTKMGDFSRSTASTYRDIREQVDLLTDNSVTKRRKAAEELIGMLGNPDIRRKLAQEGRSNPKAALAEMWRLVMRGIIESTYLTLNKGKKKAKLIVDDISFPYKLLTLCNTPDDLFGRDEYDDESTNSKLSRVETKEIFRFCFDLLENEKVLNVAEETLLKMLSHLCSRREYVAYFKPSILRGIVDEVKNRIVEGENQDAVEESARVFANLMRTTQELGMSLHSILRYCIEMISLYCVEQEETAVMAEFQDLISGASILLRSDPELAIAPLSEHGRPILRVVRRKLEKNKKDSKLQAALSDYLLSHL